MKIELECHVSSRSEDDVHRMAEVYLCEGSDSPGVSLSLVGLSEDQFFALRPCRKVLVTVDLTQEVCG